ncbi:MAG: DUF4097 family beta strand repeat-containing protein [Gemmatimonadota bacterium]|nr:DUF4097 family beta strand repeat-containing protein [Gemmatimonadota bacterium]
MSRYIIALVALVTVHSACTRFNRAETETLNWSRAMPPGSELRVRGVLGQVNIEASTTGQVEIQAVKHGRGDIRSVHVDMVAQGNDVTVCASWRRSDGCRNVDGPRNGFSIFRRSHNDKITVDFTLRVPPGVRVIAGTVIGSVTVRGATTDVTASSVSGTVDVWSHSGTVKATAVNGDVAVRIDSLASAGALVLHTVNGSARAELPASIDADVHLSTLNGELRADYPLGTDQGGIVGHNFRGVIGKGGSRLELTTVNGNVELRKRG